MACCLDSASQVLQQRLSRSFLECTDRTNCATIPKMLTISLCSLVSHTAFPLRNCQHCKSASRGCSPLLLAGAVGVLVAGGREERVAAAAALQGEPGGGHPGQGGVGEGHGRAARPAALRATLQESLRFSGGPIGGGLGTTTLWVSLLSKIDGQECPSYFVGTTHLPGTLVANSARRVCFTSRLPRSEEWRPRKFSQ